MNMPVISRRLGGIAAVVAVVALAGCGDAASSGGGAGQSVLLGAHDYAYSTGAFAVTPGTSVTVSFTNTGTTTHNVTVPDVNVNLDAAPGTTQTVTFSAPQSGTLAFHCRFHPTKMTGTITVGSSAPAAAPSASPSGSSSGGYPGY